jgi:hypothetical protein
MPSFINNAKSNYFVESNDFYKEIIFVYLKDFYEATINEIEEI